VYQVN